MFFSIIVPVYKVEDYIDDCVKSILSQSYSKFELILVDDGSPDQCPEKCDYYRENDTRIKVIHKTNGGLSSARNAGLDVALGEYIMFIDSDDILKEGALLDIHESLQNHPDILITEIYNTSDINSKDVPESLFSIPKDNSKKEVIKYVFSEKTNTWASVQYIFRRNIVEDNALRFDLGYYHEDVSWTARLFAVSNSFSFYNKTWYIRRLGREGSITSVVNPKRTRDMLALTGKCFNNPLLNSLSKEELKVIHNQFARAAFSSLIYYNLYTRTDKKVICKLINENIKVLDSAIAKRHRIFVKMIHIIGPDAALMIYCLLFRH